MSAEHSSGTDGSFADTVLHHPTALVIVTAPESQAGRSVAVGPAGIVLGRDANCDLALPKAGRLPPARPANSR